MTPALPGASPTPPVRRTGPGRPAGRRRARMSYRRAARTAATDGPAARARAGQVTLGRTRGEVDDDEVSPVPIGPAPGEQIMVRRVVPPARVVEQLPLPGAHRGRVDRVDESAVEVAQAVVGGLVWASGEKHGRSDPPPLELAFVPQHRARQGRDDEQQPQAAAGQLGAVTTSPSGPPSAGSTT